MANVNLTYPWPSFNEAFDYHTWFVTVDNVASTGEKNGSSIQVGGTSIGTGNTTATGVRTEYLDFGDGRGYSGGDGDRGLSDD